VSGRITVKDLSDEARTGLERMILGLADGKRLMGIRYSDWLLGAPSIESGIAMSSMCQDEWGHARLLYAMLKELGRDPAQVEHERSAREYASPDALDAPFSDWAGAVAAMLLMDGALTVALDAFGEGTFELARSRVPKMIAEEEFHHDLGAAWFRRFAKSTDDAKERLNRAATSELPKILAWLDRRDGHATAVAEAGVMPSGEELRSRFEAKVGPFLEMVGVDVSSIEPDRTDWDEARGRGPGAPDAESLERARGDRNRMLLVE
jgi:ring-1,2-phenylacetyl-CoA epoxidase subunit PaaC